MGREGGTSGWSAGGRVLVLVVGVALGLAACGDDDAETAATGLVITTSTAAPTPTTAASSTTTTTSTTAATTTTTAAAGSATTTAPAAGQPCETVAFTPNSEDAASDIRATGLSCEEAEAFVRTAGASTSSGGPEELDVAGYHCVRTASEEDPLPTSTYECTMGTKQVTFVRS